MAVADQRYDDFELRIDRDSADSYRVVARASAGQIARGTFVSPVADDDLDRLVQRVGLSRRRRSGADDRLATVERFGASLFDALIRDDVGTAYYAARAHASAESRGLRITLRLSGAPELMRLPWEFLYKQPRFIAQSVQTPVVRALDLDTATRPHVVKPPLRVLGIVSSPVGYPELDVETERLNLEKALGGLIGEGLVELVWLERATLAEIGRRISEDDDIHIVHYVGHGAYDEATESGVLVLETPQGRAQDVSGRQFGAMLQDEMSLRLVVLNACEGARTSRIDPFSGVATSLVQFDIPAVVAMQFEITDEAAIAFSDSLYDGLARGLPIDAAIAPARRAIVGAMKEVEFATPVLFLRSGDARLFDVVGAPAPREPETSEVPVQEAEPAPVPAAEPELEPEPEATPEPEPEPEPEPVPAPEPEPSLRAEPAAIAEPAAAPADQADPYRALLHPTSGGDRAAPASARPTHPGGRLGGLRQPVTYAWIAAGLWAAATVALLSAVRLLDTRIADVEAGIGWLGIHEVLGAAGIAALAAHLVARSQKRRVALGVLVVMLLARGLLGLTLLGISGTDPYGVFDTLILSWLIAVLGLLDIAAGTALRWLPRGEEAARPGSIVVPAYLLMVAGAIEVIVALGAVASGYTYELLNWIWICAPATWAAACIVAARLLRREMDAGSGDFAGAP
ncbi:CHAT domain-containing protein [Demequina rhizosphaerae]|uniref:CHAT domain-containing protein n=1 Tax=Demequina rhizosphaerae TaxID=1638985 RepID=UPI0007837F0B|nr:CHAT domain-containing protein [Demequina rhizosphaerae]